MNRVVLVLVAILCLLSLSSLTGLIHLAKADGVTITINADGSISPSTAPISTADNITYTLTGNINIITNDTDGIDIERNNIVLNGAGYTVSGSGNLNGVILVDIGNVTVRNMMITNFSDGVQFAASSNNTLSGNNVANNWFGIYLGSSSDNNTISNNNITTNSQSGACAIALDSSSGNTLSGNNLTENSQYGIYLVSSSGNTLSGNNITNNHDGIFLDSSSNNIVNGNNVTADSDYGIQLGYSDNNTLSGNMMVGNGCNLEVDGSALSDFLQSIDTSNLINGKPVYYFVNQSDIMINPEAYPEVGYLGFVNCVNVTVQGMNLTSNVQGLLLAYTNDSEITDNNIANNNFGIELLFSSNCTLSGNNVTANVIAGIYFNFSSGNTLYGNNAANNYLGIDLYSSSNNSLSGNNSTANNGYGIYLYSSSNNTVSGNGIANNSVDGIYVESSSNNTVSDNNATANNENGVELDYSSSNNTLSGNNVTANNYVGIYLVSSSNNTIYNNNFNNTNQVYSHNSTDIWDNGSVGNYWSDYLANYPNATETDGSGVWNTPYVIDTNNTDYYPLTVPYATVPEFPSFLILTLFMIATLVAVIIYKKKAIPYRRL